MNREEVSEALEECSGNLRRAAWILGVHEEALKTYVRRENLQVKSGENWVERTRAELGGDDDGRGHDR